MAKLRKLPERSPTLAAMGVRLRIAREFAGLRQDDVAKALDMHRGVIVKWETGKGGEPGILRIARAAAFLNVSLDWVVSGTGDGPGIAKSALKALIRDMEKRLAPKPN